MINELYAKNILGVKPNYNMFNNNEILLKRVIFRVSTLNLRSVMYFFNIADMSIKLGSSKAKHKHLFRCKYLSYINTIFKIAYIMPLLK